ncbi:MAG: hypothetical protein DI598_17935 [Pseudopedobacter saltans]|uniref:DUF2147 domain-containing protein n=1 Tax=Pseudopedobacter saltans TaxID=151895 RepID=A0A2W5EI19_9SPHI|nr:MAG: hypothetical protein DI598_17935 [Pseudopedobacter saltans]
MYKVLFSFLLMLVSMAGFSQNTKDPIIGKWTDDAQDRTIEFVAQGDHFNAVILKAKDGSLVGKTQISGLQKNGSDAYKNGTIYVIKQGKTASCTAKINGNNQLVITGKMGFFSKSQTWTRTK